MVRKVFRHFGYEEFMIYCSSSTQDLERQEVDRSWVRSLEDELYEKCEGAFRDNKCGFVFEDDCGYTVAVTFYDFKAVWIKWRSDMWGEKVPNNLGIKRQGCCSRVSPTRAELGLPANQD